MTAGRGLERPAGQLEHLAGKRGGFRHCGAPQAYDEAREATESRGLRADAYAVGERFGLHPIEQVFFTQRASGLRTKNVKGVATPPSWKPSRLASQ